MQAAARKLDPAIKVIAGDVSDAGRTYWTPPVDSEEVTLEISLN